MNKILNLLGIEKITRLSIITLQFQLKKEKQTNKQTNKQANKQSNPLTLTVSCEKRSCLIRSKKKKVKPNKKQT